MRYVLTYCKSFSGNFRSVYMEVSQGILTFLESYNQ